MKLLLRKFVGLGDEVDVFGFHILKDLRFKVQSLGGLKRVFIAKDASFYRKGRKGEIDTLRSLRKLFVFFAVNFLQLLKDLQIFIFVAAKI
jgi:hypothetical protein